MIYQILWLFNLIFIILYMHFSMHVVRLVIRGSLMVSNLFRWMAGLILYMVVLAVSRTLHASDYYWTSVIMLLSAQIAMPVILMLNIKIAKFNSISKEAKVKDKIRIVNFNEYRNAHLATEPLKTNC